MAVPQIAGCQQRYYHLPEIFDARGRRFAPASLALRSRGGSRRF